MERRRELLEERKSRIVENEAEAKLKRLAKITLLESADR